MRALPARTWPLDLGFRELVPARAGAGDDPYVVVLGTAQDAGHPQAGCPRPCCARAWDDPERSHLISCLAIVDPASGERWLVDATPDLTRQLRWLDERAPGHLSGVLLTHAHVGHYTGLMFLGPEAMGAKGVPVLAMPRMAAFLAGHGPWSLLVERGSVSLRLLAAGLPTRLNPRLAVTPLLVPHRDEFSETVGFRIEGPSAAVLYLPDIDGWAQWSTPVEEAIRAVDLAWIDGTFFDAGELPGRDPAQVPHPLVVDSLARFRALDPTDRARIRFIHLNHTNPLLDPDSAATRRVADAGLGVAREGEAMRL